MSELDDDLRTTAEAIKVDAGRVQAIEDQKLQLDPHDPRISDLADEAESVAVRLLQKARVERQLAGELADEARE